jgi:aminoglycoside phosphotransferase (APT) family kinase protein
MKNVAERNTAEFDPDALDGFLKAAVLGVKGALRLERIAGGKSNPNFFAYFDKHRQVIRKPLEGALPSAHAVDREYRIISALARTGVPVPPALLYCADRAVVGTPFYVMERVDGRVFHDCMLPGVSRTDRQAMYESMARTLAALHNVDFAAVGLGDFGKPGNYFARQVNRWSRQWQLSRTREDLHIERLIAWLPEHIPADETTSLVHGDYRIGNLMFHRPNPRVVRCSIGAA